MGDTPGQGSDGLQLLGLAELLLGFSRLAISSCNSSFAPAIHRFAPDSCFQLLPGPTNLLHLLAHGDVAYKDRYPPPLLLFQTNRAVMSTSKIEPSLR